MEKYFKSHKIFSFLFSGWVILQIIIFILNDLPTGGDNLVFPFETTDVHYYGFWEQVIYSLIIVWFYNAYSQRRKNVDEDDEVFNSANVEFISDQKLNTRIIEIIQGADKFLMLVCPFIQLSPPIKKELKLLKDSNLELFVIFGKNEGNFSKSLAADDLELFKSFRNVRIGYVETLHAKFYANQDYLILSSLNLLEYSQIMNSECGIRIKPASYVTDSDNKVWNETLQYFKDLYDTSKIVYKNTGNEIEDNINLYYGKPSSPDVEQSKPSNVKSSDSNLPKNAGNPWTDSEETQLLQLFRSGKSMDEIARGFERTIGGIKARLVKLGEIEE